MDGSFHESLELLLTHWGWIWGAIFATALVVQFVFSSSPRFGLKNVLSVVSGAVTYTAMMYGITAAMYFVDLPFVS